MKTSKLDFGQTVSQKKTNKKSDQENAPTWNTRMAILSKQNKKSIIPKILIKRNFRKNFEIWIFQKNEQKFRESRRWKVSLFVVRPSVAVRRGPQIFSFIYPLNISFHISILTSKFASWNYINVTKQMYKWQLWLNDI